MSDTVLSRRSVLLAGVAGACLAPRALGARRIAAKPNIILIYADDLGYGDLGCYGARTIATPHIDRLAARGTRFRDGHSPSATCTPSRYALLTGDYAWRASGAQILPGDAPALIRPGRFTLPAMLQRAGYTTGLVGKWHLGLGDGTIDWNGEIGPGPLDIGFDSAFFLPATLDRVPTVLVDGRRVAGLDPADPIRVDYKRKIGTEPTGTENPDQLTFGADAEHAQTIVNGISRIGWMTGGRAARWKDEELSDVLLAKAVDYISARRQQPFFLYYAVNEPHVPRAPHPRFVGASGMGPRGDAILQLDWTVGQITAALDRLGLTEDTLIVFSSDNGPILFDGYQDHAAELAGAHRPAGPLRSGKYSIYEGGTRVPMIACWPGHVRAGHVSDALVDHVDLVASLAALVGQPLPPDQAVDSLDMLDALLGRSDTGRDHAVEDSKLMVATGRSVSSSGERVLALREGRWKLIRGSAPPQSFHGNPIGTSERDQLYDLRADPGEANDLAAAMPARVRRMAARLAAIERRGRTRP